MASETLVPRGFADLIPYATPESLDDLYGPTSGVIRVSSHINTAPEPTYNLDDPNDLWAAYSAIVRDGYPDEQATLLDRATLLRLWPDLNLPRRCRDVWTARFPELRARPAHLGRVAVKAFHERLARIGLSATEPYGFALAGGYAISANGIGDRPSMDVDLFTNGMRADRTMRRRAVAFHCSIGDFA